MEIEKVAPKKKVTLKIEWRTFFKNGIMVGNRFVRRDIPGMTNDLLIECYVHNMKMMNTALDQGRANAVYDKKVKSYIYYSNNRDLLVYELNRRCIDKEGIWYGGGIYMTAEDAKHILRIEIEQKEAQIKGLSDVDAHAIMVNWDTSMTYIREQLRSLEYDYPIN